MSSKSKEKYKPEVIPQRLDDIFLKRSRLRGLQAPEASAPPEKKSFDCLFT